MMVYVLFALFFAGFCSMTYLYFSTRTKLEAYKPIIDLNREIKDREQSLQEAQEEYQELRKSITRLTKEVTVLNEDSHLLSSGFYKIKYDFKEAKEYEVKLQEIREAQKNLIQNRKAIVCATEWLVSGSKALGKKMTERTIKLGLAAFNVQCDNEILKVRFDNIALAEDKIGKIRDMTNKLLEPNSCQVTDDFFDLKLQELHLVYAYHEKIQKEKNQKRVANEKLRDEEKTRNEVESIQMQAEREERRYREALDKIKREVSKKTEVEKEIFHTKILEMENKLKEAQNLRERARSQAEDSQRGYIFVLSNIGAFGEGVYKIGATKRLDPMDRIYELSGSSVPFDYDVHGLIYCENVSELESLLHQDLAAYRINKVNAHKDFFKLTLSEIEYICKKHYKGDFRLVHGADAKEWRQTLAVAKLEKKKAA